MSDRKGKECIWRHTICQIEDYLGCLDCQIWIDVREGKFGKEYLEQKEE